MNETARDRILIIDDEQHFALSTQALLDKMGFDCQAVFTPQDALKLLDQTEFDTILCDINMTGNTDLQFTSEICRRYFPTPVILLTGCPTLDSAVHAVALPVFSYIIKPFQTSKLLETLRAAIAHRKALRMIRESQHTLEGSARLLQDQLHHASAAGSSGVQSSIESYIALTKKQILDSLSDLCSIVSASTGSQDTEKTLTLLDCPPLREHRKLLQETVQVLEKTKSAFKSKDLALLRQKIESFLEKE